MGIFTENRSVKSPVDKYLSWKSNDSCFEYYDKVKSEKVQVKLPIEFVALDDFIGVSGGEMDDAGVYRPVTSGIVAHIGKTMVVKKDGETIATGKWKEIKDKVKAEGGRYTSYTYAIFNKELVCFKLAGAALAAWFNKSDGDKISVKKAEKLKKGGITYNSPVFISEKLTDEEIDKITSTENAKLFQNYKEEKLKQKINGEEDDYQAETNGVETPMPDLSEEKKDDPFDLV